MPSQTGRRAGARTSRVAAFAAFLLACGGAGRSGPQRPAEPGCDTLAVAVVDGEPVLCRSDLDGLVDAELAAIEVPGAWCAGAEERNALRRRLAEEAVAAWLIGRWSEQAGAVAPIEPTDDEIRAYYEEHRAEWTRDERVRVSSSLVPEPQWFQAADRYDALDDDAEQALHESASDAGERRPAGIAALNEVEQTIADTLRRANEERVRTELIATLTAAANIEYVDDAFGFEGPDAPESARLEACMSATPDTEPPIGEFVEVPAGTFLMGEPPGRSVAIARPFAIGRTEVTQQEWTAVAGSNPSAFPDCGLDCPVESVSLPLVAAWLNARSDADGYAHCYQLVDCDPLAGATDCAEIRFAGLDCDGYRLPTEAEWEYAAAGAADAAAAWHAGNASDRTHPVARFAPSALGLYDVAGNVAEVVWSWPSDGDPVPDADDDPLGACTNVIETRGGSYADEADDIGVTAASMLFPGRGQPRVGFRVARTLSPRDPYVVSAATAPDVALPPEAGPCTEEHDDDGDGSVDRRVEHTYTAPRSVRHPDEIDPYVPPRLIGRTSTTVDASGVGEETGRTWFLDRLTSIRASVGMGGSPCREPDLAAWWDAQGVPVLDATEWAEIGEVEERFFGRFDRVLSSVRRAAPGAAGDGWRDVLEAGVLVRREWTSAGGERYAVLEVSEADAEFRPITGTLFEAGAPEGLAITFAYDAAGRLVEERRGDGSSVRYDWACWDGVAAPSP